MEQLNLLKQLAHGISTHFGRNCEVVIHDLKRNDLESSIVYIENGQVSNRSVGDGPSSVVVKALKNKRTKVKDRLAYLTKADDGRLLKSSTVFIRNEKGEVDYIFSINFDITMLKSIESALSTLVEPIDEEKQQSPQIITHNVNDLLGYLIKQSVDMIGKPVSFMTKDDKIRAIKYLNDMGAFLVTKSGDKISALFGISKFTLYNYIDAAKQMDDEQEDK